MEAPEEYYLMYGDPDYAGIRHIDTCYGPADGYSKEELAYIKAQYSGLVTHVDHWFGEFMQKLDSSGLADTTAVLFISDHGTNFCENPRNVIGKPNNSMYPAVMQLPLLIRLPGDKSAGTARNELVYNLDLSATVYDLANLKSPYGIDGQSLLPLVREAGDWQPRHHVTCRYVDSVCYIDDDTWALGSIDGKMKEVFDLASDPKCMSPLDDGDAHTRWKRAWKHLLSDAGGSFPDYRSRETTDALGRAKK